MTTTPTTPTTAEPERRPARLMLALIALETSLPVPTGVHFLDRILSLTFASIAEGLPWLGFFDQPQDTYIYQGRRYLKDHGCYEWHGWSIQLYAASAPAEADTDLDADITDRLAELTAPRPPRNWRTATATAH